MARYRTNPRQLNEEYLQQLLDVAEQCFREITPPKYLVKNAYGILLDKFASGFENFTKLIDPALTEEDGEPALFTSTVDPKTYLFPE